MARTTIRSEDIADGEILVADVADDSITNAKIKSDAAIAATKLAGTLDLSSKTVTLPAASVTAHVTAFDDASVRNDIAPLALHSAIADNKAAYNLSNSFIDQYEDATGIDTTSTASRRSGEYVTSGTATTETLGYGDSITIAYSKYGAAEYDSGARYAKEEDNATGDYSGYFSGPTSGSPGYLIMDLTAAYTLTRSEFHSFNTNARPNSMWREYSTDNSSWTEVTPTSAVNASDSISSNELQTANTEEWHGINFTGITARYWRWRCEDVHNNGNTNAGISEQRQVGAVLTNFAASGNYTSTTQASVASVSSMGIVVLYKDDAGTASLNSDLVAQVSANGGTNYANATLVAGGTFSTGIKIAAVSGVSVTAGTTPKYKISFANQVASSKETHVYGVALLY